MNIESGSESSPVEPPNQKTTNGALFFLINRVIQMACGADQRHMREHMGKLPSASPLSSAYSHQVVAPGHAPKGFYNFVMAYG